MNELSAKLPLTLSNLLASGNEGKALAAEIWGCVNYDDGINDFLSLSNLFWKFSDHKQSGYIYLLQAGETRYFKIGKSINPDRRLTQIKPKMPFETKLIGVLPTDYMSLHERVLHWSWSSSRANGEWFVFQENDDHANHLISRMKDGYNQPSATLESFVGGMIQALVSLQMMPWVRENFDTDIGGDDSGFYLVAREIATVASFAGGI